MPHRDLFTLLFGLHVIWTGLWRSIQAAAYKPNSLWFCLIIGLVAIVAGFLYRKRLERAASITAFCAAAIIFTFYFREFITQPEKDATFPGWLDHPKLHRTTSGHFSPPETRARLG